MAARAPLPDRRDLRAAQDAPHGRHPDVDRRLLGGELLGEMLIVEVAIRRAP